MQSGRRQSIVLAAVLTLLVLPGSAHTQSAIEPPSVPGVVLVQFDLEAARAIAQAIETGTFPAVEIESVHALFAAFGVHTAERVFPSVAADDEMAGVYKLTLSPTDIPLKDVVAAFEQDPHVIYAEPDTIMTIQPEGLP